MFLLILNNLVHHISSELSRILRQNVVVSTTDTIYCLCDMKQQYNNFKLIM